MYIRIHIYLDSLSASFVPVKILRLGVQLKYESIWGEGGETHELLSSPFCSILTRNCSFDNVIVNNKQFVFGNSYFTVSSKKENRI